MVKERIKNSKGITLIALIITILILIILTALVVKITVDKDFFGKTKKGVNTTNNKIALHHNNIGELMDEFDTLLPEDEPGDEPGDEVTEPEKIPQITLAYSPTLDTWTNEDVTVTANVDLSGYDIQMSDDGTNWESGNTVTLDKNGKVYARAVKNGSQVGNITEGEVTNIDKELPEPGTITIYSNNEDFLYIYNKFFNDGEDVDIYYLECSEDNIFSDPHGCTTRSKVCIELEDGTDDESGHYKTTYNIYRGNELVYIDEEFDYFDYNELEYELIEEDIEGNIEIDAFGIYKNTQTSRDTKIYSVAYKIIVTTEDNAGNKYERSYFLDCKDNTDI